MKLSEFIKDYEIFVKKLKEQILKETPELKINIVRYLNKIPDNIILEKSEQKLTNAIIKSINKISYYSKVFSINITTATYENNTITVFSDVNAGWHFYTYKGNYKLPTIITMYHEQRHYLQEQSNFANQTNHITKAICDMENIIKNNRIGDINYLLNHDSWFIEIDANEYGIKRTMNYILENTNSFNHEDIKDLKLLDKKNEYLKLTYSFDKLFTAFNKLSTISKNHLSYETMPAWYKLYYKSLGKFHSLSTIMSLTNNNNTDPLLTTYIITSKSFLSKINYNKLKNNEIEFLYNNIFTFKEIIYQKLLSLSSYFTNKLPQDAPVISDKTITKDIITTKREYYYYLKQLSLLSNINDLPSKKHK